MIFRDFLKDIGGNYAIAVVVGLVPLMGGVALAVDFAELNRERQAVASALDAAGIATARHIVSGATDEAVIAYAQDFFEANLGPVDPGAADLSVTLPSTTVGGGTLKLTATLTYKPHFYPVFQEMMNRDGNKSISAKLETEIRLKNTLEVALVLDNSGSMEQIGSGSGDKRINLLKTAAKDLVERLAQEAALITQVDKPVQFGLVPFAASVNVGADKNAAPWMDVAGISPIHHENFDWTTLDEPQRYAEKSNGVWYKRGGGWGADRDGILSRFSLYKDTRKRNADGTDTSHAAWNGCVEARPWPYNVNDAPPDAGVSELGIIYGDPETLFVPMFAPDEPGDRWATHDDNTPDEFYAPNNWWNDGTEGTAVERQKNMAKYFDKRDLNASSPAGVGPNYSCTTKPITPLTDVTTSTGLSTINSAISGMNPGGATNVPEGIAWGWRVVSGGEPFTEGRPDSEKGNDKVVIVLTDGVNTYYTPGSLGYADPAGNKSTYSAFGYTGLGYDGTGVTRLFMGTGVGAYDYSNSNYTAALNEQMASVCGNAKTAGVIVMTVSLDLSTGDAGEAAVIDALKSCASDSRFRRDPNDSSKPAKLYWNATGGSLSDTFDEIADELSNLRIVS